MPCGTLGRWYRYIIMPMRCTPQDPQSHDQNASPSLSVSSPYRHGSNVCTSDTSAPMDPWHVERIHQLARSHTMGQLRCARTGPVTSPNSLTHLLGPETTVLSCFKSALCIHTNTPYKTDLLWKTLRAPNRPSGPGPWPVRRDDRPYLIAGRTLRLITAPHARFSATRQRYNHAMLYRMYTLVCRRSRSTQSSSRSRCTRGVFHNEAGVLTQGGQGGRPAPLASRLHTIPTHFLPNLHGI
jgi:hypothetical protein